MRKKVKVLGLKGLSKFKRLLKKNKHIRGVATRTLRLIFPTFYNTNNYYDHWKHYPTVEEYYFQTKSIESFNIQPVISIVMPTYNTPVKYLRECIDSVLIQSYPNWELCVADDASPNKEVVTTLEEYAKKDNRIKIVKRRKNGHISAATNSAIEISSGGFIALLDHDDVLWPNALYEIVRAINEKPETDFIYTDEDKINGDNTTHSYPFFKPDWSPEFLESCNYITHFSCIRKELVDKVGGLRIGYEGAQDWDLFLRVTEITNKIHHIPKLLYSWRIHEASTASDTNAKPYVYVAQKKLLEDHLSRTGREGVVKQGVIKQHSSIEYFVEGSPSVAVMVQGVSADTYKACLSSFEKYTTYDNVQLILIVRNAKQKQYAKRYVNQKSYNCKIVEVDDSMSFAAAYNAASKDLRADYHVFIDGRMVINTRKWLQLLLGDVQNSEVGVVGTKTLFSSKDRILSAGCGMGIYELYAPLLEGMPAEDVHYLRGLYGQSRRNIAAVDSGCVIMSKNAWSEIKGFSTNLDDMYVVDACLSLLKLGYRNIYNPFVETVDLANFTAGDADLKRDKKTARLFQKKWAEYITNDPYLNRHLVRTNAQLDIK